MPAPSFSDLQLSAAEFRPLGSDNSGGRPAARDDHHVLHHHPPVLATSTSTSLLKFGRSVSSQALLALNNDWKQKAVDLALTEAQTRCSMDADVNAQLGDVLRSLQPNTQADADRAVALAQVEALVKKSLGAKVFPHGSHALKTYLPDSDLNLCAFFTHNNHKAWGQRALKLLTRDDAAEGGPVVRDVELVAAPDPADGKLLRATVGAYTVEISANSSGVLASCALFEEVDRLVDQNHLFKRAIILAKAWAQYDAQVLDARHGLLSSYAIRTMVLFVFNAFHRQIRTPLDALLVLLQYLSQFDWTRHVFGLFGPVHLASLPQYESVVGDPCSWPSSAKPLISKALLSRYAVDPGASAPASADAFTDWSFNLIDPRNPAHNLGAGLSRMTAAFVKDQLTETAHRSLGAVAAWERDPDPWVLFGLLMPGVLARLAALGPVPRDAAPALDADLGQMTRRIAQAGEFDMPDIKERDLVQLMVGILQENDSVVTVGKMGSLMHSATNNHALPAMLKARYGGLKKLLRRHEDIFAVASDHPHNPHVMLLPTYERALALWSTPDCSPTRSPSPPSPAAPSCLFAPVPQHIIWPSSSKASASSSSQAVPPRPASVPVHSAQHWCDDGGASVWSTPAPTPPWYSSLPEEFFCPISGDVMRDPVVASDGVTYDRASVEVLRQSCRTFSPLTGLPLDLANVYPNLALKSLLAKIRSEELVLKSRPTGALSRIGHYYERCASIWG